tara:strand:- start:230 stop:502 length:273 start_codon:yes stop_codon:yes gene_type:complete
LLFQVQSLNQYSSDLAFLREIDNKNTSYDYQYDVQECFFILIITLLKLVNSFYKRVSFDLLSYYLPFWFQHNHNPIIFVPSAGIEPASNA